MDKAMAIFNQLAEKISDYMASTPYAFLYVFGGALVIGIIALVWRLRR